MSGLAIGSLTLSPAFSSEVTSYTTSTTNKTNTVKATAASDTATISITMDNSTETGKAVTNGSAATWADGINTLTVTVTDGGTDTVYTVVVTKS